jgi:hypothetical protein
MLFARSISSYLAPYYADRHLSVFFPLLDLNIDYPIFVTVNKWQAQETYSFRFIPLCLKIIGP